MKRPLLSLAAAITLALPLGCQVAAEGYSTWQEAPTAVDGGSGGGGGPSVSPPPGSGPATTRASILPSLGGGTKTPPPPPCNTCSAALGGNATDSSLCASSLAKHQEIVACACNGTCAALCGHPGSGDCIVAWKGNPPLDCELCLTSPTGCGQEWKQCLVDDGVSPAQPPADAGPACTCDAAIPACPGGGECATPGGPALPGNGFCGSAEYCASCCDTGDGCAMHGLCKTTKVAGATCAADYECCSGTCQDSACLGGCGSHF